MLKKMLTTGGLALAIAGASAAHAQVAQSNQPSVATAPPAGAGPTAGRPAPDARQLAPRTLPNAASALPFIVLGAVLAVVLAVMIRIGVNSID